MEHYKYSDSVFNDAFRETMKEEKLTPTSLSKDEAEAEKLLSEALLKKFDLQDRLKNQDKKNELNLAREEVRLEKLKSEARKASFEADCTEIVFRNAKREEDKILSSDRHNHVYRFVYPVCEEAVQDCMQNLSRWSRLDPGCEMEIVFCSPGGSTTEGFALFDFIQELKRKGHKITTKTIGYAASMAGVLLQAGTTRVMSKESWLLIHETSFNVVGKIGVVDDTVEWVKKMTEHVADIFSSRAAEKTGKPEKAIKSFVKKNWNRKDWWLSADEALALGFCDRVE
jgi:ATP-dependent protease ClpP protease subunit